MGLKAKPRKYQRKGVNTIFNVFNGRALLADDMGLGKTLQAIMYIDRLGNERALIACPGALKYNWVEELAKFMPGEIPYICQGQKPSNEIVKNRIIICNYEIVKFWTRFFIKNNINILICDESHYLKNIGPQNKRVQRTAAILRISKKCRYKLLLTGTPIENSPAELFTQLKIIDPKMFPSWLLFVKRYAGAIRGEYGGWKFLYATNAKELHKKLKEKCMIRRTKKQVLKELPPKVRIVIPLEIDNRKEYEEAEENIIKWLRKNSDLNIEKAKKAKAVIQLDKLKLIAAKGKIKAFSDWVNEESQNQKLVVFCYHRKIVAALSKKLKNCVLVDSSLKTEERQKLVNRFQKEKKIRVFLTTIRVGGTGLTLTAASTTSFIQLDWNAAKMDQAEDRVNRIGQEADSINAIYFIAKDTIEEKIIRLIDARRQDAVAVIDGKKVKKKKLIHELLIKELIK